MRLFSFAPLVWRAVVLAGGVACAVALGACASSSQDAAPGSEEISQLPWSRPQAWEGQGMLGGMVPSN